MTDDDDEIIELYQTALHQIEAARKERIEQFPRIEALKRKWKANFEGENELRDGLTAQVLIDILIRDVEDLLDPDEEDPVDPEEWIE